MVSTKILLCGALMVLPISNVWADSLPRLLHVSGEAKIKAAPDKAMVTISLYEEDKLLEQAKKKSDRKLKQLRAMAQDMKIEAKHMRTLHSSMQPRYHYPKNSKRELTGYTVEHRVQITLMKLERIAPLMARLVAEGFDRLENISYGLKDEDALKDKALRMAVKRAKQKAEFMAEAQGVTLGAIQHLSDGTVRTSAPRMPVHTMQRSAMMAMDESAGAVSPPVGEMEIYSHVQAQYEMK